MPSAGPQSTSVLGLCSQQPCRLISTISSQAKKNRASVAIFGVWIACGDKTVKLLPDSNIRADRKLDCMKTSMAWYPAHKKFSRIKANVEWVWVTKRR